LKRVDVFVKGPGAGRESAIRAIAQSGIDVDDQRRNTVTT